MTLTRHTFPEGYVLLLRGSLLAVYAPAPIAERIAVRAADCTEVEALLWAQGEITRWRAAR